mmetsp:Transcript_60907/g.133946  ORF Transcript_60907/g.133946 Transcript_60907/m.133946 type:complete len:536 (-) Transcript_60907:127-1734(-)
MYAQPGAYRSPGVRTGYGQRATPRPASVYGQPGGAYGGAYGGGGAARPAPGSFAQRAGLQLRTPGGSSRPLAPAPRPMAQRGTIRPAAGQAKPLISGTAGSFKRKIDQVSGPSPPGPKAKALATGLAGARPSGPLAKPGAPYQGVQGRIRPVAKAGNPSAPATRFAGAAAGKPAASSAASAGKPQQPVKAGMKPAQPAGKPPNSALAGAGKPATPGPKGVEGAASARGSSSSTAEANKAYMKQRKIEALHKQLLDEWVSLAEDKKAESIASMTSRLMEKVAPTYLAQMAEQFANPNVGDVASRTEAAPEKAEPEAEAEEQAAGGEEEEAGDGLDKALELLFKKAETRPAKEWGQAWKACASSAKGDLAALKALLEAAAKGGEELCALAPKVVTELTQSKMVDMKAVEQALQAVAGQLETLVKDNDSAWHVLSHLIVLFFPKHSSSTWGLQRVNWTWHSWWLLVQKALQPADHFRAFDILVYVLQLIQEKSGVQINELQAWKEAKGSAKVRQVLGGWGEMDETSITETLTAYGVVM